MENNNSSSIEYFEITGAPGKYFKCPRYHGGATLSVAACAAQWRRASKADDEARIRLHACINCPTGANHAGVPDFTPQNPIKTGKICARCHRTASRIIHGRICVSCVNRQYEIQKGRNARGNKPSQCPTLHNIPVLVCDGDKPAQKQFLAVDMIEALLSAMKTAGERVAIGFKGAQPKPAGGEQLALF